jgi:DNA-binding transcriptional MerR regulator
MVAHSSARAQVGDARGGPSIDGATGVAPVSVDTSQAQTGTWPHALSHEPLLRVSDVLALLEGEFPTVTPSKLRFLDAQGLVTPDRTPSGYRHYSPADVERLRFVLRQQRDHYRPLTVIAAHLDALDRGMAHEGVLPHAVGEGMPPWLDDRELAAGAGVEETVIDLLVAEGFLRRGSLGKYAREDVDVVRALGEYLAAGGDVRSLRTLDHAAARESEHTRTVVAPLDMKGDHDQALDEARTLNEAAIGVFSALLRRETGRDDV